MKRKNFKECITVGSFLQYSDPDFVIETMNDIKKKYEGLEIDFELSHDDESGDCLDVYVWE